MWIEDYNMWRGEWPQGREAGGSLRALDATDRSAEHCSAWGVGGGQGRAMLGAPESGLLHRAGASGARWMFVPILLLALIALAATLRAAPRRTRPLDPVAARMEPDRKILYRTVGDAKLHLHVFLPQGFKESDKRACLFAIHGGGWTGMNSRYFYPFAHRFAQKGMVGISIDYRLANARRGVTVFDCVKDVRSAMRYVKAHAAELGIDPYKIAVCGGSAGGHLASATSLFDKTNHADDDLEVSSEASAMILYYPVIDTSEKGYGQKKIGARWKELSPVDNVRKGLPPTLIFHGTGDTVTPFEGAALFVKRSRALGNEVSVIAHEGGVHGYFIFDLKLFEKAMRQTEAFLAEQGLLE